MARAHLFRPVTDEAGNLLYGAQVTVRTAEADSMLPQPLWSDAWTKDPSAQLANPFTLSDGFIDLWLDTPTRVNLLIESAGREPIVIYLDVQPPASEIVVSVAPLAITNVSSPGQVLTGTSPTEASWQPAPQPVTVPVHNHPGTAPNTVALGTGAKATADSSTAVGDSAFATGTNATAYGSGANAAGVGTTSLGSSSSATGANSTAVGYDAHATNTDAVAAGQTAVASGQRATAIGTNAQAIGDDTVALGDTSTAIAPGAVAIGKGSQASAAGALAVGSGANASHNNSVAFGPGAATTADNQVMLGTAGQTVVTPGGITVAGNAVIGSAGSVIAFFGTAGATKQTVTGSDGNNLTLRALLTYLDSIGLITNQSIAG
jgi:autotransporter adhesin